MQKLDFKFPLTVSCVHFICSSIGAYIAIHVLKAKPLIEVESEDRWKRIFPMSFVFCINIVLGNVSLRYILRKPSWQSPCSMDTNLTGRKKPIPWRDDCCFISWCDIQ
jgi:hypothetical protein